LWSSRFHIDLLCWLDSTKHEGFYEFEITLIALFQTLLRQWGKYITPLIEHDPKSRKSPGEALAEEVLPPGNGVKPHYNKTHEESIYLRHTGTEEGELPMSGQGRLPQPGMPSTYQ